MPVSPHDLANQLGIGTDRLLIQLRAWGWSVNGPFSRIPDPLAKRLCDYFPVYVEPSRSGSISSFAPVGSSRREHSTSRYVLDKTTQQVLSLLDVPNLPPGSTADVDQLNLRLIREGLGMTVERAAAVLAVSVGHLQVLERGGGLAEDVRRVMSGYGIHMAAWWSHDALRLQATNFDY